MVGKQTQRWQRSYECKPNSSKHAHVSSLMGFKWVSGLTESDV